MNKSESITNLAKALKQAQSEMGEVKFDATNPFLKNRYASLGAVIQASKDALVNNGLSVSQPAISDEHGVGITTLLMHETGEWIETSITLPLSEEKGKSQAQVAGSIISYLRRYSLASLLNLYSDLRRYSLASLLNLYSDEDNDGNEPKAQSKPVEKPTNDNGNKKIDTPMSIEKAEAEVGSDGKKYGDCTDDELAKKMIGISKGLNNKEATEQQRNEYMMKRDAILTIQAYRKG